MPRLGSNSSLALGLFLALAGPVSSQGVNGQKSLEGIVGDSDIRQEEATTSGQEQKVLAAIDKTTENTSAVRKLASARQVDIVFLADAQRAQDVPSPKIEQKLKDHQSDIVALRQEIEANALLFHAVDSRRVMTRDILAVEFPDPETVIVYAATKPPG